MVEFEELYNYIIIIAIIIAGIVFTWFVLISPALQKTASDKIFDEERNAFLQRFCQNTGFQTFKLETIEGTTYNFICLTESSQNVRLVSYQRYGYDKTDKGYKFYVMQDKK